MGKVIISESRLKELVAESLEEVLMESMEDEGALGDFARNAWNGIKSGAQAVGNAAQKAGQWVKDNGGLAGLAGQAYQGARNTVANAKKNFEAGRLKQRAKNVDFNPMTSYENRYGEEFADKMRAQRGDNYGQNRYDTMVKAWGGDGNKNGEQSQSTVPANGNTDPMPLPQNTSAQNAQTQNGGGQAPEQQAQGNAQQGQSPYLMKKNAALILQNAGFTFDKKSKQWMNANGVPATKSRSKNVQNSLQQFQNASNAISQQAAAKKQQTTSPQAQEPATVQAGDMNEARINQIVSESIKHVLNEKL